MLCFGATYKKQLDHQNLEVVDTKGVQERKSTEQYRGSRRGSREGRGTDNFV